MEQEAAELKEGITAQAEDGMRAQRFVSLVRRYTSFDELTAPMLNEFIEKVVVHEADKSTGDRRQKVDIYFNFIGCFVPPKPEVILTAEEEAKAQKALAARNREREQNKLRMRRVREAQRAVKETEKVSASAGCFGCAVVLYSSWTQLDKSGIWRDKMDRPITTLFMLMSVDGKISTGATDDLDVDKDFPKIMGVQEGLHQYYEIEQTTDLWSLNSGRVQEKIGINMKELPNKSPVSFVIIDNSHLTEHGIRYFCALSKEFVLITSNKDHPAFQIKETNLHIIYQSELSLADALTELKSEYGCQRITIQSGGTLNGLFLREKLFDYIDIVVAPVLIGGKDTSTLIDGKSLLSKSELSQLGVLKLQECTVLEDSYIRLRYKVIH